MNASADPPNSSTPLEPQVGYSDLASNSWTIKKLHFWIFSVIDKLIPCVLLLFFTTALIRTLLKARTRRLRLNNYGGDTQLQDIDNKGKLTSPEDGQRVETTGSDTDRVIPNGSQRGGKRSSDAVNKLRASESGIMSARKEHMVHTMVQQADQKSSRNTIHLQNGSVCATDNLVVTSSGSSASGCACDSRTPLNNQQPKTLSNLIVESITSATNNTTVSTTTLPLSRAMEVSDEMAQDEQISLDPKQRDSSSRSASTCGALNMYGTSGNAVNCDNQPLVLLPKTVSQNLANERDAGDALKIRESFRAASAKAQVGVCGRKSTETTFNVRDRSFGSLHMASSQMVKLQTAQRQLNQNETTTKLLVAVMLVFLICETPAGIMGACCAIFGEPFFENVYIPMGIVTDLLALINSSVNFALYCLMSTQFRQTFYSIVLRCPSPNPSQNTTQRSQAMGRSNPADKDNNKILQDLN